MVKNLGVKNNYLTDTIVIGNYMLVIINCRSN